MTIKQASINQEDKKAVYQLTMAPNRSSVQSLKGHVITVTDYALFTDTNNRGEEIDMLSICTADGAIYTTISQFCIREAIKIFELFGVPVDLKIDSLMCNNGREAIYCTLA